MKPGNARFVILSSYCRNPGFEWVMAITSGKKGFPKVLLLQEASTGNWCLPNSFMNLDSDESEFSLQIAINGVLERIGRGFNINKDSVKEFHSHRREKYFLVPWEASTEGIEVEHHGRDGITKFTGHGWFTSKELRSIPTRSSEERKAIFKALQFG